MEIDSIFLRRFSSIKGSTGALGAPASRLMPHTFCGNAPEGRFGVRKLACALKQLVIDQGGSKLLHFKARALRSGSRILSCAGTISFLLFDQI
jgi:hypothetical protein